MGDGLPAESSAGTPLQQGPAATAGQQHPAWGVLAAGGVPKPSQKHQSSCCLGTSTGTEGRVLGGGNGADDWELGLLLAKVSLQLKLQ